MIVLSDYLLMSSGRNPESKFRSQIPDYRNAHAARASQRLQRL